MLRPSIAWISLGILYAGFFGWYTSFGGPLTAGEIDLYLTSLRERGGDPERLELWRQFMESDTGDDFAMFNAIHLRDTPLEVAGVEPGESSSEVLGRYTEPFLGSALRSAAHPLFMGDAAAPALDLWGIEGAEQWSSGGIVRYRSRRDLMEQALRTQDAGHHEFKIAAMEKTIAYPLDPFYHLGDPRLVLALLLLCIGLAWHLRCALGQARDTTGRARRSR